MPRPSRLGSGGMGDLAGLVIGGRWKRDGLGVTTTWCYALAASYVEQWYDRIRMLRNVLGCAFFCNIFCRLLEVKPDDLHPAGMYPK